MADWLQYDPNTLPWMRRSGEAAREATAQFQFGAQLAQRREEQRTEEAYKERVLQLQKDTLDLQKASALQVNEGTVEASKVLSQIAAAGSWDNPESEAKFLDVAAKYPAFASSAVFPRLRASFENARKIKAESEALKIRMDRGFAPSELEKSLTYMIGQGYITQEEAATLGKEKFLGPSETMEVGTDEQGRPVVKIVKGRSATVQAAGPTTAVKTDLQKDINNTRQALPLMADLEKNLRAEDVGLRGVIGETVMDRLLPQFGVGTLDPKRTDNRTKLRTLVQSMLRQISPDNRFTNEDRKRIEEIMPDLGVLENVDRAKQVLSELSKVFSERNVRDMQALKAPLEMPQMSNEEIAAAVRMNLIDRNAALEFFRQFRANQ